VAVLDKDIKELLRSVRLDKRLFEALLACLYHRAASLPLIILNLLSVYQLYGKARLSKLIEGTTSLVLHKE